jgi:hypothetical protein
MPDRLAAKVAGWLCPNGEFIQCQLYEHIDIVSENPYFIEKVPKISDIIQHLEDVEAGCRDLADREGSHNAEWHCYEMACDDARHEIRRLLLNEGFIRVGESDEELYFEGRPNVLKSRHQVCKDLAESYGTTANFEPVR